MLKGRLAALVSQLDFIFFVCVVLLDVNRVERVFFCGVRKERNRLGLRNKTNGFKWRTWCAWWRI